MNTVTIHVDGNLMLELEEHVAWRICSEQGAAVSLGPEILNIWRKSTSRDDPHTIVVSKKGFNMTFQEVWHELNPYEVRQIDVFSRGEMVKLFRDQTHLGFVKGDKICLFRVSDIFHVITHIPDDISVAS